MAAAETILRMLEQRAGNTQTYSLAGGWQKRVEVYILYHLLNHLNLFGGSYGAQCQAVADRLT